MKRRQWQPLFEGGRNPRHARVGCICALSELATGRLSLT